jgi:hypothetical protein
MQPDLDILSRTWRSLLPPNVKFVGGVIDSSAPALTGGELGSVGQVAYGRMMELRAGRHYARQALSLLGIDDVEVPIRPDRSPAWPNGTTGSITHVRGRCGGYCAVAVGLISEFASIGLDVEYQDTELLPEVWPTFLTKRELSQIYVLAESRRREEALCRWCVKEAVIKAARAQLDALSIETEKAGVDGQWSVLSSGSIAVSMLGPLPCLARSAQVEGLILAVIAARQL